MADRIVATRTLQTLRLAVNDVAVNGRGDLLMTAPARTLSHLVIELCYLNVVGIPAGGEIKRMPESVVRFHRILTHNIVRRVTIIAGGHRVMAGLHPRVILRLHDVAIGARHRIVREVGISFGVNKRIRRHAGGHTEHDRQGKSQPQRAPHQHHC